MQQEGSHPRNLLRQFKDILQKAGLRDIRFHDLRHTAATFLIARGEHPRTIVDILGHSQISTTIEYLRLYPRFNAF